jgi:hypothetical protein
MSYKNLLDIANKLLDSVRSRGMLLVVVLVWLCSAVLVQAQTPTGRLSGMVMDANGDVIGGVSITVQSEDRQTIRSTTSDAEGRYQFVGLVPGGYSVRASATGFASATINSITIGIGGAPICEIRLAVKQREEDVTVSSEAPLISFGSAEVSSSLSQNKTAGLPVNSHQFLTLALILPGTGQDATRAFFASLNAGPSLTFNSTANVVDGVSNNWAEDGEPRQDYPEESIQEFKLSAAQFGAEFGPATGGVVQVITKSGGNQLRGSAFEYFRNKALNSRGVFETSKPDFQRNQFGATFGGPIIKDRLNFFLVGDIIRQQDFFTVKTGIPQFYSSIEGTFRKPYSRQIFSGRLDWQISDKKNLFIRYSREDEHSECSGCGGTVAATAGFDQDTPRRTLVLGLALSRSSTTSHELLFQYASGGYFIAPHGTKIWKDFGKFPAERIARLSRTYVFPSMTYGSSLEDLGPESRWQFRWNYNLLKGNHSLKAGLDVNVLPYREERTGNINGTYVFAQDQLFDPEQPASIANLHGAISFTAALPPISTQKGTNYLSGYLQDNLSVGRRVVLNLGIRYERWRGIANEDLDSSRFPISIPFIDVTRRGNDLNFAPRIGFSYTPFKSLTTVIRGGAGIYYGHVRLGVNLGEYRNYSQYNINISNPAYPDPYQGQDPIQFATTGPANINILANNFRQPYSEVFSLGVSHQFRETFALSVDWIHSRTLRDRKIRDLNPRNAVGVRPLPQFGRIDQSEPTAESKYGALYLKLEKAFSKRRQLLVSYTLSRSNDNNPLVRYIDSQRQERDWGPSNAERRSVLVFSGSIEVPGQITVGGIWTVRSQLPWTATAGIDLNNDGFNTDLVPGTTRNSGSRGLNLEAVNAWRQSNGRSPISPSSLQSSAVNSIDARISRTFRINPSRGLTVICQMFNLLNSTDLQSQFGGGRVTNSLSNSFGQIPTARPARQIEMGLRFFW